MIRRQASTKQFVTTGCSAVASGIRTSSTSTSSSSGRSMLLPMTTRQRHHLEAASPTVAVPRLLRHRQQQPPSAFLPGGSRNHCRHHHRRGGSSNPYGIAWSATTTTQQQRQLHQHQKSLLYWPQQQQQQQQQQQRRFVGTTTSSSALNLGKPPQLIESIVSDPFKLAGSFVGLVSILALLKYRGLIQRQLKILREESWIFGAGVTMERVVPENIERSDVDMKDIKTKDASGSNSKNNNMMMSNGAFRHLSLLELNDEFKSQCEDGNWKLLTLGEYMSQLRPRGLPKQIGVDDMPQIVQREIEAGLAAGLLKALGPNLGRALLPAVNTGFVQSKAKGLASRVFTNWFLSEDEQASISQSNDKGGIPIGLLSLLALSDANAKLNNSTSLSTLDDGGSEDDTQQQKEQLKKNSLLPGTNLSAMDKMKAGEVVAAGKLSFVDEHLIPDELFVVDEHFDAAIRGMEARLRRDDEESELLDDTKTSTMKQEMKKQQEELDAMAPPSNGEVATTKSNGNGHQEAEVDMGQYDPDDRRIGDPVPINPRLFPDLHAGYGGALNSHTKREVLKMRLISILLNRLGSNYYRRVNGQEGDLFKVRMSRADDNIITTPGDFVKALIESGHSIEVVPASRMTTFGGGMSVKEKDGSWTQIPLGVFIESGYEDKDGNMAPAMLPHSGLNMYISGPLAGHRRDGTPSRLTVQHFIGIEGFCGWQSHAQAEVPFNEDVPAGIPLSHVDDVVRAARIAGLYATSLNGLATSQNLPFGGYGLTAVCNDSAAIVQQCLYGENTIFPMTSIGKYMQRTMRYAQNLRSKLAALDYDINMEDEVRDLDSIAQAMRQIPNDINASPSNAKSAAKRLLRTLQPKMPFVMMSDAKKVMESILEEEDEAAEVMENAGANNKTHQQQQKSTSRETSTV